MKYQLSEYRRLLTVKPSEIDITVTGIQKLNSIWVNIEFNLEIRFDLEMTLIRPSYAIALWKFEKNSI